MRGYAHLAGKPLRGRQTRRQQFASFSFEFSMSQPDLSRDQVDKLTDARAKPTADAVRIDSPAIDPGSLWIAISQTPGVGVSITDREGRLLFVNDTAQVLFSQASDIDYAGKRISDFHPPEYVRERLAMIQRVLEEGRPLSIEHIYHGCRIHSTVWPIRDAKPPYNRVIVVSRDMGARPDGIDFPENCETVQTDYIDLGSLDVLSRRELEVLALLGHGLSVPRTAAILHRSPKTIERHKASIARKLGLHGQAEIVAIVTSVGLDLKDTKLKRLPKPPPS